MEHCRQCLPLYLVLACHTHLSALFNQSTVVSQNKLKRQFYKNNLAFLPVEYPVFLQLQSHSGQDSCINSSRLQICYATGFCVPGTNNLAPYFARIIEVIRGLPPTQWQWPNGRKKISCFLVRVCVSCSLEEHKSKFDGIVPYMCCIIFWVKHKHNSFLLGPIQPLSPTTKQLH